MKVYSIQEYDGVDALQGPHLPFLHHRHYFICDSAYCTVRDLNPIDIPDMAFNIAGCHAFRVHGQDFFFHISAQRSLAFLYDLRVKFAFTVTGNGYIHVSETGFQSFLTVPIAAVVGFLVSIVVLAVAHSRFVQWQREGLFQRILGDLGLDVDLQDMSLDSTCVKAHQHSAGAKKGL